MYIHILFLQCSWYNHKCTHTECPGGTTIDPSVFEGCTIIQGSLRVTNPDE